MPGLAYIVVDCSFLFNKASGADRMTPAIDPPPPLNGDGDLVKNWCVWKAQFLSFLKRSDPAGLDRDRWAQDLLLCIGPIGQQVHKKLTNNSTRDKEDLDSLLRKMDIHFVFGARARQLEESVEEYIDNLTHIAKSSNYNDVNNIVKEKIIQDVITATYTGKAQALLQSMAGGCQFYLRSLSINEIGLVWKQCEQLMSDENEKKQTAGKNVIRNVVATDECSRCGTVHSRNRCPAHGTKCSNCGKFNHYTEKCKVVFVNDCQKCGANHVQSRCLAYGELCSKCGKTNHFSWKCQTPLVKDCFRCGKDHFITACPAEGKLCSRCKKPNHLAEKCVTKLEDST